MTLMRSFICVPLLTTLLGAASFGSAAAANPRSVLELFTSQGCSSCPPADKLFAKLAHDPQFIVLSLPVDYWDRLGWKDTFAKHAFTERQRAYASLRGDGQVYTPQAVVNGSEHANGSSRRAIDAAAETTPQLSVPVGAQRTGDDIVVSVGAAASGGAKNATIVLLPYLASRDVAIGRGENAREKVTYTNIVRDIVPIAEWSGSAIMRTVPFDRYKDFDGVVVLLQAGSPENPGAILGATRVRLDERAAAPSPRSPS
jgi:hypothetical protein